jgi:hypothetical protein
VSIFVIDPGIAAAEEEEVEEEEEEEEEEEKRSVGGEANICMCELVNSLTRLCL